MNVQQRPRREGFVEEPHQPQHEGDPGPREAAPALPAAAEAPAPEPPAPPSPWPVVVKLLHKPLRIRNQVVTELRFREPTGADVNRYGNPVHVDVNGEAKIDEKKMSMMMSSLAGLLLPDLEAMDPRDWNSCAYRLRGFFLPDPEAWL